MKSRPFLPLGASLGLLALLLSGCGSTATDPSGSDQSSSSGGQLNQQLHDALPEEVRSSKTLDAVMIPFAPYVIEEEDGKTVKGASIEVAEVLSGILGVTVKTEIVPAFSGAVTGIQSGRYDFGLGPYADNATTRENFTFVDWIQEFVVFLVPKGNPAGIAGLSTACGHTVAVLAGGSAESVVKKASAACPKPIEVRSFEDANAAILAVQSGRADGYFSSRASLVYYKEKSGGAFELAGEGEANGFENLRQGSFFAKDSKLTEVVLKAFEELQATGKLGEIMAKWGLAENEVEKVGLDLAAVAK
ncbi:transporter substrate-binding domain-containing protein [Paenarthrobacter sp. NPDC090520]|uniref:transporter substrate-binding domain-containing protein n=1 Tax=Paenarthrobacter sp. NPDC090520 TaxID=3364382 RepID=UPI003804D3B5